MAAPIVKIKFGGTFEEIPNSFINEYEISDQGRNRINLFDINFSRSVIGTTYEPSFGQEIRVLDGTDVVYGGRVENPISDFPLYKAEVFSFEKEIQSEIVNEIYENKTVEFIVEDLVTKYTNLTYSSSVVTGVTVDRIVFADKNLRDAIVTVLELIDYYYYTTYDKKFYIEQWGSVSTGKTIDIDNGDVIEKPVWKYNSKGVVTKIIFKGGLQNFNTSETFTASASQTTFTLLNKPSGNIEVSVNGTEQDPQVDVFTTGDYTTNPEDREVIFNTGLTSGDSVVINYAYTIPVKVTSSSSVTDPEGNPIIRAEEITKKSIKKFSEARKYVRTLLDRFSVLSKETDIQISGLQKEFQTGRLVTVSDNTEGINEELIILNVEFNFPDNVTEVTVGSFKTDFFDYNAEVQERLRQLEEEEDSSDTLQQYRQAQGALDLQATTTPTYKISSPVDSFILGHVTLGRLRTDLNFEADCSNNGNHGTWQGTGISGSQYDNTATFDGTSGFTYAVQRLSSGIFNGTDNEITSTGISEAGIRCVSLFYKEDTNTGGLFVVSTGNYISIDASGNVTTTGLTGVTVTTTDMGSGVTHVYAEFDSITMTNPVAGNDGTNYFDGKMDEITAFDAVLTSSDREDIQNNLFDKTHSKYANCKLWWSCDNPRLGNRRTTKVSI